MPIFDHPLNHLKRDLRLDLLDMIYQSGGGHIGGSFSCLDILISLYYSDDFDFKKDHFVLSAGHLAPSLYTVLASKKYFPKNNLKSYSSFKSPLQGHISTDVPGVEYSSGSLGQGLSFAAGLALGDPRHMTVCLTTDGEHQEGQIWEATMFASKYHLGNLINIVDQNGFQIDGSTDQIMPLKNLAAKYIQFGWTVITVDGHNLKKLNQLLKKSRFNDYPLCIIAKTTIGKGIPFMENNFRYHDVKNLSETDYESAKNALQNYR
jgi:transketolase